MSSNIEENKNRKLLSVIEAAEYLKVSKFTIKRWLRAGKLQGSKLGGNTWKVFLESCNNLIDRGANK